MEIDTICNLKHAYFWLRTGLLGPIFCLLEKAPATSTEVVVLWIEDGRRNCVVGERQQNGNSAAMKGGFYYYEKRIECSSTTAAPHVHVNLKLLPGNEIFGHDMHHQTFIKCIFVLQREAWKAGKEALQHLVVLKKKSDITFFRNKSLIQFYGSKHYLLQELCCVKKYKNRFFS